MSGTGGEQKKASTQAEERLGREAWAPLFALVQEQMRRFPVLAAEFELSPVQAHVLSMLGYGPQPMSALADYLSCDASNVTGLVDRLEGRGLMERRNAEHDRRVKLLCLTEAGQELRQRLQERLLEPPEVISALSPQEKRLLRDILSQALERLADRRAQGRSATAPDARQG